jgi:inosose dehydratase
MVMPSRRALLKTVAAAAILPASRAFAEAPAIRFGVASVEWNPGFEQDIPQIARLGVAGIEPFRNATQQYEADPAVLKAMLDAAGLTLITCASHPAVMATDFLDPAKADQTVEDHVAFARSFLRYFQCDHFKISLGPKRGDPLMTPQQLKQISKTLDRIGEQTSAIGIRLAPHPLIGSVMEREPEVRAIMELTNPRHVWMTADTGHLTLGGMDPVKIISEYFPRIAEVHLKDTVRQYRGWNGPSDRDPRPYRTMGAGGVDFPAIYRLLKRRGFKGWCSLDIDGTDLDVPTAEIAAANMRYLTDVLHVDLRKN